MIRLYDFNFNLISETDHALSSEWEIKLNGIGTFEGSFPVNSEFSKEISKNKFLLLEEDGNQAIIVGRKISDKLTVIGKTPEWLLSKRVVLPFKTSEIFSGEFKTPEEIIVYLLDKAYKEPQKITEDGKKETGINKNAVCENLIIPPSAYQEKLTRHFWRNTANPLSDVIHDLCDLMGAGFNLRFDVYKKQWIFSLIFPEEKSLMFSKSLKNCFDMGLYDSLIDYAGGGYFEKYTAENEEDRVYGYIEDSEIQGSGMLYWEKTFSASSGISEAENQLLKSKTNEKIDFEVFSLEYGKDYKLGDIFPVQFESGPFRTSSKRKVTAVSIINSGKGKSVKPTLGEI